MLKRPVEAKPVVLRVESHSDAESKFEMIFNDIP